MDDWKLYCPKCGMIMTLFGVGEIGDDYLYGKWICLMCGLQMDIHEEKKEQKDETV